MSEPLALLGKRVPRGGNIKCKAQRPECAWCVHGAAQRVDWSEMGEAHRDVSVPDIVGCGETFD